MIASLALLTVLTACSEPAMTHRVLVHLTITDAEGYAAYRAGMEPILAEHGGRFVLDVEGGTRIHHDAPFAPGRTLLIEFPDAGRAEAFYANPAYVDVRDRWFTPSVSDTHATVLQ
ncbi:MAG: DUF1330 domain-containing protein [Myxococcota bacterium]